MTTFAEELKYIPVRKNEKDVFNKLNNNGVEIDANHIDSRNTNKIILINMPVMNTQKKIFM
jgi:hypothetical protein